MSTTATATKTAAEIVPGDVVLLDSGYRVEVRTVSKRETSAGTTWVDVEGYKSKPAAVSGPGGFSAPAAEVYVVQIETVLDRNVAAARSMFDAVNLDLGREESDLLRALMHVVEAAREASDVDASTRALAMIRARAL